MALSSSQKPILLIVVNTASFFLSHRLPIAQAAVRCGFDVHVATARSDASDAVVSQGFAHHEIPLTRSGKNPARELFSLCAIFQLMRRLKPDIVHLVTIKPVLYGGLAARLAGIPGVVVAISGLGSLFVESGLQRRAVRTIVEAIYRSALKHRNLRVIFQNGEDKRILTDLGAVRSSDSVLIPGSGVDLELYPLSPESDGVPVISFAARLLKEKGVVEFVEAARILRRDGYNARFLLIGEPDIGNPSSVTRDDLEAWGKEGVVELLGYRVDIPALFKLSNIIVLPSYYGEGLPKVLIEAAACGRAVVTTDHPGCRDAIEPGVTGLLVPPRDPSSLAKALKDLLDNPDRRFAMGEAGRELATRRFDLGEVVATHIRIYQELLGGQE
jgi:glycosyltransferase involved in cell wall biosynthesis